MSDPPANSAFVTTRWSLVCAATEGGSTLQVKALEELCRAYWKPLHAYVRRCGYGPDDAQDLTQAFFEQLLKRGTLAEARVERGRFRTFLLTVLHNFLADKRDRALALKRGGAIDFVELSDAHPLESGKPTWATAPSPDAAFDREWALVVLERASNRLREEFASRGREEIFNQLKAFLLVQGEPERFEAACAASGITLNNGRVTLHRLRERFPALVREEVAQTVRSSSDLDAELRYLLEVLSQ